jgi:hypothetical protein
MPERKSAGEKNENNLKKNKKIKDSLLQVLKKKMEREKT